MANLPKSCFENKICDTFVTYLALNTRDGNTKMSAISVLMVLNKKDISDKNSWKKFESSTVSHCGLFGLFEQYFSGDERDMRMF